MLVINHASGHFQDPAYFYMHTIFFFNIVMSIVTERWKSIASDPQLNGEIINKI